MLEHNKYEKHYITDSIILYNSNINYNNNNTSNSKEKSNRKIQKIYKKNYKKKNIDNDGKPLKQI